MGAIFWLAKILVIAAAMILVKALATVQQLNRQLPTGPLRNRWYALTGMIVLFIIGYVGYVAAFWSRHNTLLDLIVPGIFFFGGCFVWLTARLALQTAIDVMRVTHLERQAFTDSLTGSFNRRFLDQQLGEDMASAHRYGYPLSVILLDIDSFKQINDGHGHQAGDEILIGVARTISAELREQDVFARFGGEEFCIIAPHTPLSSAVELAERLRKRVQARGFVLDSAAGGRSELRITISLGVAGLTAGTASADDLIRVADRCLYQAKRGGRNRVVAPGQNDAQVPGLPGLLPLHDPILVSGPAPVHQSCS